MKNASLQIRGVTNGLSHDTTCKAIHLNYIPEVAGQTTFESLTLARKLDKGQEFSSLDAIIFLLKHLQTSSPLCYKM